MAEVYLDQSVNIVFFQHSFSAPFLKTKNKLSSAPSNSRLTWESLMRPTACNPPGFQREAHLSISSRSGTSCCSSAQHKPQFSDSILQQQYNRQPVRVTPTWKAEGHYDYNVNPYCKYPNPKTALFSDETLHLASGLMKISCLLQTMAEAMRNHTVQILKDKVNTFFVILILLLHLFY